MRLADRLVEALEEAKPRHDDREVGGGRYKKSRMCDACGKSTGTDHMTDDEVCGSSDGPGFFLCDRTRCMDKRNALSVAERRDLYTAQRAKNTTGG